MSRNILQDVNEEVLQENVNLSNGQSVVIPGIDQVVKSELFNNLKQYSLAQDIFPEIQINSPTGAFFNVKKKGTHNFELVRNNVEVFSGDAERTGLTKEAYEDLVNIHGQEAADKLFAELFAGILNQDTNERTQTFLDTNSKQQDILEIPAHIAANAELMVFYIIKRVGELVHEANHPTMITRKAYCVMPYEYSSAFEMLSLRGKAEVESNSTNIIARSSSVVFVQNPNKDSKSVYVGMRDNENASKSQAVLSPYVTDINETASYETGDIAYHIFDRYAITANPLHDKDNSPMMWKFDIQIV